MCARPDDTAQRHPPLKTPLPAKFSKVVPGRERGRRGHLQWRQGGEKERTVTDRAKGERREKDMGGGCFSGCL